MKTELSLWSVVLCGLVMRIFNVSANAVVLLIALMGLSLLYLFGSFYFLKTDRQQNSMLSIFSGIALSIVSIALLFKVLFWSGAYMMSIVAFAGLLVAFITAVILNGMPKASDKKLYYHRMIWRLGIASVMALCLLIIPTDALIRFHYRGDPERAEWEVRLNQMPKSMDEERRLNQEYDEFMNTREHFNTKDSISSTNNKNQFLINK